MPINIRNTETSGGERRKRHKHVNTGRRWWPVRDVTVSLHTRTHTADHLEGEMRNRPKCQRHYFLVVGEKYI